MVVYRWLLLALLSLGLCAQTARPPNIVFVLVDDLGWSDLSCQGSGYYRTPNIDRLAATGLRFTDAYAACAVCSPTRAAVLTGRSPARTGVTDWIRARFQRSGGKTPEHNPTAYVGGENHKVLCPPNPFWLEQSEVTLAEALGAVDYVSCHIGKWHLGDAAWYPEHQGFDENHGGCDYGQPPSYFDPYRNKRLSEGIPTLAPRDTGEYLTDREADEAVDFIRRHRDRPFFLYLAHYAVHTPIQAKQDLITEYRRRPKTNQKNAKYAAMVHSVDDAVGKVLDTLEQVGISDDTLVVFSSDNGGLIGPTDNAPLRSGKGFPYEGGIRVPLVIRWPGVTKPGSVSHQPVSSVDYFPTLLEAAEVAAPANRALDGTSLLAHLRSPDQPIADDRRLFWHFPHYRGRVEPYSIVRDGDWKLIKRYGGPSFELFNLAEDLGETTDLAARQPHRVQHLNAILMAQLAAVGAKLPRPNPGYRAPARVLLLGDSISIGYDAEVRRMLGARAEVCRPRRANGSPENCAGTTHGVQRIDHWLSAAGGDWDIIHFNFGLHDLKRVHPETRRSSNDPAHPRQASPEVYEDQLRKIVAKLKRSGAELIFATTTPVPAGARPRRDPADVLRYNAIATAIMREHDIGIDDLYSYADARLDKIQRKANVHFTADGSKVLGRRVVEVLKPVIQRVRRGR